VHQLEAGLGVQLIDRSKRPFVLTAEGETYYAGCRRIVERYFALEEEIRTLQAEPAGRLRVASIYSVGLHHMNQFLQQFLSQCPKVNVRLEYQHPRRVCEMVEKDQADLGLVSYPKSTRSLTAIPWREEPMLLVTSPAHRLSGRSNVRLDELAGERMIGFDAKLSIQREIDRVLAARGVHVQMVMAFDNVETMKRAIEIDAGIGLLPEPTVAREVAAGTLKSVPLADCSLVRPLGIVHRRGKALGKAARRFLDLLLAHGNVPSAGARPVERRRGKAGVNGRGLRPRQADGAAAAKLRGAEGGAVAALAAPQLSPE
jgi:DNA-binding transcriptional LysR family regulator